MFFSFILVFAAQANAFVRFNTHTTTDLSMLQDVMKQVHKEYVHPVEQEKLIEYAIDGMLSELDPNSSYLDPQTFKEMQLTTTGKFGGIGVEVVMENGFLKVITPYKDGPAFAAGIREGDYITMVNGESIKGMKHRDAVLKVRGEPKTNVILMIYRASSRENIEITVQRDIINIDPVRTSLIDDNVIHFSISSFANGAADHIERDFYEITTKVKGIKGIVLDVRWNPGGLLDEAYKVSNLFLSSGTIVSIKGRNKEQDFTYSASGIDIAAHLPIIVLINGGSASASEIVAAALHDNKRAVIMGTKSFGKGSVQSIIPMTSDSAIKLTTALYYTPNGVAIEESKGVDPDIEIEFIPAADGQQPSLPSHKKSARSLYDVLSINSTEIMDNQLLKAVETMIGLNK